MNFMADGEEGLIVGGREDFELEGTGISDLMSSE